MIDFLEEKERVVDNAEMLDGRLRMRNILNNGIIFVAIFLDG